MAYASLPAIASGNPFSLSIYDQIRENFNVGVPGIVSAKGDLVAGLTVNSVARLAVGANGAILVPDSSQSTGLAWQIQPATRVRSDAAQAITSGVWTLVTFNLERYDTDAMHSTSTNTSRITVPANGAGIYRIGANVNLSATGARTTGARILLNGTTVIASQVHQSYTTPAINVEHNLSCDYSLNVGDYVEVQAYCDDNTGTVTVQNAYSPEFWASWQRRQ